MNPLPWRLYCVRCDHFRYLRGDGLCKPCGDAVDHYRDADENVRSKVALERLLGVA